MISLSTEITDAKGRRAQRGWICFDRDCTLCTSLVRRFRHPCQKRGFGFAALQDPRVAALLNLPPDQLLREVRVITAQGQIYGGADAIVYLAKQIWWAWPLYCRRADPRHFTNSRSGLSLGRGSPQLFLRNLFGSAKE